MESKRYYKDWEIRKNCWGYYEGYNDNYHRYLHDKTIRGLKELIDIETDTEI